MPCSAPDARDPYPTRRGRPQRVPRREPVIWGDADGVLDAEARASYERDGFLDLGRVLDEETARGLAGLAQQLAREPAAFEPDEVVREPTGRAVRSLFAVHRRVPQFGELARHPRLLELARALLGSEVYVHQSRINLKPAFDGEPFQWHSDFETWHAEDGMPQMRALSISVALTDNAPWNGPLMLVAGSHRHFLGCAGETPRDHYRQSLRAQAIGTPDRRYVRLLAQRGGLAQPTGPAGSAVLFDCNTLHASSGNISPWPRINLFMVFVSTENRLRAPYAAPAPRPEFLGAREHCEVL